jgi:hypothetical protein
MSRTEDAVRGGDRDAVARRALVASAIGALCGALWLSIGAPWCLGLSVLGMCVACLLVRREG